MRGIILLGPAGSGKSRAASILMNGELGTLSLDMRTIGKYPTKQTADRLIKAIQASANPNTTLIHLCEVPKKCLHAVMVCFFSALFRIDRTGTETFHIMPRVIIDAADDISFDDVPSGASFIRRYAIYTCSESRDHEISMVLHHPVGIDPVHAF